MASGIWMGNIGYRKRSGCVRGHIRQGKEKEKGRQNQEIGAFPEENIYPRMERTGYENGII